MAMLNSQSRFLQLNPPPEFCTSHPGGCRAAGSWPSARPARTARRHGLWAGLWRWSCWRCPSAAWPWAPWNGPPPAPSGGGWGEIRTLGFMTIATAVGYIWFCSCSCWTVVEVTLKKGQRKKNTGYIISPFIQNSWDLQKRRKSKIICKNLSEIVINPPKSEQNVSISPFETDGTLTMQVLSSSAMKRLIATLFGKTQVWYTNILYIYTYLYEKGKHFWLPPSWRRNVCQWKNVDQERRETKHHWDEASVTDFWKPLPFTATVCMSHNQVTLSFILLFFCLFGFTTGWIKRIYVGFGPWVRPLQSPSIQLNDKTTGN